VQDITPREKYWTCTNTASLSIPDSTFIWVHSICSLRPGMNASIFLYVFSITWSLSGSLRMVEISRYIYNEAHYLCRGGIGGSCQCEGQLSSLVKNLLYMYKWPKVLKNAVCPAMESTNICGCAMKEDATIDEKKLQNIHTSSWTWASWKTVTYQ